MTTDLDFLDEYKKFQEVSHEVQKHQTESAGSYICPVFQVLNKDAEAHPEDEG